MAKYVPYVTFVLILIMAHNGFAKDIKYSVTERPDGGYTLNVVYSKRYWKPITAEGIFPVRKGYCTIDLLGKGEDWSYRNQHGYYYASEVIKSNNAMWDFGYAWIDADRGYLYLNLYWVSSPDSMVASDINGKYQLKKESTD